MQKTRNKRHKQASYQRRRRRRQQQKAMAAAWAKPVAHKARAPCSRCLSRLSRSQRRSLGRKRNARQRQTKTRSASSVCRLVGIKHTLPFALAGSATSPHGCHAGGPCFSSGQQTPACMWIAKTNEGSCAEDGMGKRGQVRTRTTTSSGRPAGYSQHAPANALHTEVCVSLTPASLHKTYGRIAGITRPPPESGGCPSVAAPHNNCYLD